ncbi:MAG: hypothetical protein EHM18_10805, partial [Acidobacteria bacterium]
MRKAHVFGGLLRSRREQIRCSFHESQRAHATAPPGDQAPGTVLPAVLHSPPYSTPRTITQPLNLAVTADIILVIARKGNDIREEIVGARGKGAYRLQPTGEKPVSRSPLVHYHGGRFDGGLVKSYASSAAVLIFLMVSGVWARDDGRQMDSKFRLNYLGYFSHGDKIALVLSDTGGSKVWQLLDSSGKTVASGSFQDYVSKDFASGDSFFRIDFSTFAGTGSGFRLGVDSLRSEPFDITPGSPYADLAAQGFDYFKDHRTPEYTFDQFVHNWTAGTIKGPFWNDAGDKGFYTTNT